MEDRRNIIKKPSGNHAFTLMSVHYRVFHQLEDLVWVDFGCSAICPILHGLVEFRQKRLSNWARWWNILYYRSECRISNDLYSPCPAYRLRRSSRLKCREQPEGDLGHKMAATVADAFEEGHNACIIVGADVPGSVQQSRL